MTIDPWTPPWDDAPFVPTGDQPVHPGAFAGKIVTIVAYNSPDTYERAVDEAAGQPVNDLLWLAAHGNAAAARVTAALTRQLADQIASECWPDAVESLRRADLAVRLLREVARRWDTSTSRQTWRWN
jgi:hypothetical protein